MYSVDIDTHGPVFDGRAQTAAHEYVREAEHKIAERGKSMIDAQLPRVLKRPTGYYQSQIRVDRAQGSTLITDGGVIYGPWLEGTGSRNRTTRFKGYATFRLIKQRLDAEAKTIAEEALPPYLRRMN